MKQQRLTVISRSEFGMAGHGLVHRVTNERDRRSLPCRFQHGSMRFGEITNATDGNFTRERLSQARLIGCSSTDRTAAIVTSG
jgi:hypothetical protein